ncbi:hypothetical protein LZ31DRAFT_524565 [Colletotrichum somersetense]|nr:hypothetical protein LZ31DRAFT_524565 [Colletotrichum somersetense]
MEPIIKFDIPASARSFHLFPKLPPEIRHQIWEDAILEPGMHFLRLKTAARAAHIPSPLIPFPIDDDDDEDADADGDAVQPNPILDFDREPLPSKLWPATLVPRYPTPQANLSSYITLNRILAKLSVTCLEAAAVVQRLVSQPGSLKLSGGRIVSLASSNDVVCLEYLSADNFRSWCRMSLDIECPQLANIRHVAVPYCHAWEATNVPFRCSHCGSQHGAGINKVYPVHLYEFLARHLPNLQTFYFIDYLIVKRRSIDDASPSGIDRQRRAPREAFKSNGRIFYELEEQWEVKSRVVDTLSWIQERFILYATRSKLSKHAHPEKVKFKVLVCKWADRESETLQRPKRSALSSGKPLKKRLRPLPERCREGSRPKSATTQILSVPLTTGLQDNFGFVFGQASNNIFKFRAGPILDVGQGVDDGCG